MTGRTATTLAFAAAILAGAALPALVFGRAVTQGMLIGVVVLALASAAFGRRNPIDYRATGPMLILMGAVTLAWAAAIPVSLDPQVSMATLGRTVGMAGGGLVLWSLLHQQPELRRVVLKSLLLAGAAFYWMRFTTLFGIDEVALLTHPLKSATSAQTVLVPVMAWAAWCLGGRWRWLAALAIAAVPATIVVTHARAPLAGWAIGGLTLLALVAVRRRRWGLFAGGVVLALAIVALAGTSQHSYDERMKDDFYLPKVVDLHRQIIWRFTLERFAERPLLGWGIDVINRVPGAHDRIELLEQEYIPSHPHNWAVELLAETGLVGFAAFLAALALGSWRLARDFLRSGTGHSLAGCVTVATYWSAAAFNFSIWAAWWQLVLIVALALVLHPANGVRRVQAPQST